MRVFVQLFWTGLFFDLELWTRFWIYILSLLEPYYPFAIITLHLFLPLYSLLTVNSLLNSFRCSCSAFSMYFTFYRLSVLCCLCCHCVFEPCCPFAIVALYLFLFLFSFSSHCISKNYCHRYLYDLALVLLVWLLTRLVYNFPYGDFLVN